MSGATYIVALLSCLLGVESLPHKNSSLRIVGGHAVNITEVPYMARYCSKKKGCCEAAILNERYIISIAECYYKKFGGDKNTFAIVGTDQVMFDDEEKYVIEESHPHPNYIPVIEDFPCNMEYNIVLLKLAKELKFSDRVQTIPLAGEQLELSEGAMLDTMGFGSTSPTLFNPTIPKQLQKASVPFVSTEKCRITFEYLIDATICAGSLWKGGGMFDAGAPLVYQNQLVGLLFEPRAYKDMDLPSIYTPISTARKFIDFVLENGKKA